ncbi:MAG: DUF1993 domain-containing protein [Oceanicaulis sp.]
MPMTNLLVPTYVHMLQALAAWLNKAVETRDDADSLMSARLAPDMLPLSTQVRFACVQAHEGVLRLKGEPLTGAVETLLNEGRAGGEAPGTLADALERIEQTLEFLSTVEPGALDPGAGRPLALELPMGIAFDFDGERYARDWALPQLYFHVTAAYMILRHHGVALGKADYVPHMFAYLRPGTGPAA